VVAQANVRDADAQIDAARAQIAAARAELAAARLDLLRTVILAPSAGVVIDKLVEPGATVTATFQTPTLFEIASDLTRMQVDAAIDEADIGEVHIGQTVQFTVDAYPGRSFDARVQQIRKAATEVQNAVSYLAILSVENNDGALLPGMTANVSIVIGARAQALRVPIAALSFAPRGMVPGDDPTRPDVGLRDLWVRTADPYRPARRRVRLGLQGEDYAEVVSGLKPGEVVLTSIKSTAPAPGRAGDTANE
jgi:HlyD family secretion protein